MPSSISDKLKALGVKAGAADLIPPKSAARFEIDSIVPGVFRPTRAGEVFVAEQAYPMDYRHGDAPIQIESLSPALTAWSADARMAGMKAESFAFLDTETSGLSGGTGTYAFLVGVARFVDNEFRLAQFFLRDPSEEAAMLEGLADFLAPCAALVTFNGKAFDAPLLRTRYTLHNIPNPFADFAHLDLLPLARQLWRDRLPSRALKYLEENILSAPRTSEEVPGYEIPWLYFDYLRSRDATPLKGVFYHNAMDVVAMAALLSHVSDVLNDPFSGRVEHGLDFIALGKLFEDLNRWEEAARLYERGLESDLTEADFGVAVKRLSILQKRRGDLVEAVRLWEQAAARGQVYAQVELAKYYEHQRRDATEALRWALAAREQVAAQDVPVYIRKHWLDEIEHRLARLERKAGL
ncbi:MAG TPA: ribonuclease H-like domain-containing protein [Anaerolineales bacterium]|nr:ribonuclease H-like domain-containing protein [Anaerolineales bacterium]